MNQLKILIKVIVFLALFMTTKTSIIIASYLLGLFLLCLGVILLKAEMNGKSEYNQMTFMTNILSERP